VVDVDILCGDLLFERAQRLIDPPPEDEDEDEKFTDDEDIGKTAVAFFVLADICLQSYLYASPTARLHWRSHRQFIFHRAAAECLKIVESRIKASRRKMVRARFQHAVWKVMNPDTEIWDIDDDIPAKDAYYRYHLSAMEFRHFEANDLALRRILSDHILLDKLIKKSEERIW
jgi:hypothetical protein